jgi:hypothetical protein
MKKELKDWIVPWLYTSREYNVGMALHVQRVQCRHFG